MSTSTPISEAILSELGLSNIGGSALRRSGDASYLKRAEPVSNTFHPITATPGVIITRTRTATASHTTTSESPATVTIEAPGRPADASPGTFTYIFMMGFIAIVIAIIVGIYFCCCRGRVGKGKKERKERKKDVEQVEQPRETSGGVWRSDSAAYGQGAPTNRHDDALYPPHMAGRAEGRPF